MSDQEMTPQMSRRVKFGPFDVDFHTQEFLKHGIRLRLSGQPLQVLEALLARPGELVTRAELQQILWADGTFADFNHSLNAAVNKLREALGDSADTPRYIETLPRRGYRFIGTIDETVLPKEAAPPPSAPAFTALQELPAPLPADEVQTPSFEIPVFPPTRSRFHVSPIVLAVFACCLGVVALSFLNPPHRNQSSASQRPLPQKMQLEKIAAEESTNPRAVPVAATLRKATKILEPALRTIIPGDSNNAGPSFSPDGKRIAFMSNRSGNWQIWVSNADGSNPMELSYGGGAGTPRWSPDGQSITYDGVSNDGTSIFVISVDKREPARQLVRGMVPSFSRDGKWIYFASDRNGDFQVWKISLDGTTQKQVTYTGGFSAQESADGYVYFSKTRYPNPGICRVPVSGGEEECALPHLTPRTWSSWAVTRDGILFVEDLPQGSSALSFYEPARKQVVSLTNLPTSPFWMGATADGKQAIINDSEERQIAVVDNLR